MAACRQTPPWRLILWVAVPGAPLPIGVVLAGGLGRRIGGDKAMVTVGGRPLLSFAIAALREALGSSPVAVVAKAETVLAAPPAGVEVWIEPDAPRHPVTGLVCALERAQGRDVLVLAVDLPLVTASVLHALVEAAAAAPEAVVVAARAGGRVQPLCAIYRASALRGLRAARPGASLSSIIEEVGVFEMGVEDADALLNVNTGEDARRAERLLEARG